MKAIEIIELLKRGECWCQKGIGNPMYQEHTEACKKAQKFMEKVKNGKHD